MAIEFMWSAPYSVKMGRTPELSPNSSYEVNYVAEGLSNFASKIENVQCTAEKVAPVNDAEFYVYDVSLTGFKVKNNGGNKNFFNWQVTGE